MSGTIAREPEINEALAGEHGLSPEEFERIRSILGRTPNFTELGIFAVMWSEHCSYKSSKVHLQRFPTKGKAILQGPGENAGVVDIGDGLAVIFKIESHNHPSFIEPYQGAATGVGGIIRDIFTMGARPIALLNSLRFGPLREAKNRYLLDGVVAGISGYGNAVGVPTVGGEVFFSETYRGNPLVNVFCLGIAPKDKIFLGRAQGLGNPVIYVGSKTGRDGIHGVTMASEEFGKGGEERRPTVQVGDPFTEKVLIEACLELMATDCLVGIQDMGGAGLTCSSCEMASRGGVGIEMDLEKIPRREEGMIPYEVMLSESQERMLLVARAGTEGRVLEIFKKWDLDAAIVGKVTDDGMLRVTEGPKVVGEMPAKALAEEGPVYQRPMQTPAYIQDLQEMDLESLPLPFDLEEILFCLLRSPNIARKSMVWERYDHMLFLNTTVLPGSDAAVLRLKGTRKGLAICLDGNGRYGYLDPRMGGMIAVAEAARNVVCSGARPLAITNCLNFGNPENPEIMWQFAEAVEGMAEACRLLEVPVTGGNVSFYNETSGQPIFPTPIVGMVGLLEDISLHQTQWFKEEDDLIFLLGENQEELGGSECLKVAHGFEGGRPPHLDLCRERSVQDACLEAIRLGMVKSAHDCSDGGLAIALAESCITHPEREWGIEVELKEDMRPDALLFGESQSRIIISLPEARIEHLMEIACRFGIKATLLGRVKRDRFRIKGWKFSLDVDLKKMRETYQGSLSSYFR
jgi:phosphoribosylformylglycinamidine synthase subunit PurL